MPKSRHYKANLNRCRHSATLIISMGHAPKVTGDYFDIQEKDRYNYTYSKPTVY